MSQTPRTDGRRADELRPLRLEPGIAPHATGSVLCCFGKTQVICAVTIEKKVPGWMMQQKVAGGWITAEYSLLPYSTHDRKQRDIAKGKLDGRTVEIQRLIGRALRAVTDLSKLPGMTLWIDCDVLQADGGTRTASITGAYVAARLAVHKLMTAGELAENPLVDTVAAISAGIWQDQPILDLDYPEDRDASVDANIVVTGSGRFVELQVAGEESTYDHAQLGQIIALGTLGAGKLAEAQKACLAAHAV